MLIGELVIAWALSTILLSGNVGLAVWLRKIIARRNQLTKDISGRDESIRYHKKRYGELKAAKAQSDNAVASLEIKLEKAKRCSKENRFTQQKIAQIFLESLARDKNESPMDYHVYPCDVCKGTGGPVFHVGHKKSRAKRGLTYTIGSVMQ